jgi:hypothetical protein
MIVKIKIGVDVVTINEGVVLCDNNELENSINSVLSADPNRSPNEGFYPQIFEAFDNAELISVTNEDRESEF